MPFVRIIMFITQFYKRILDCLVIMFVAVTFRYFLISRCKSHFTFTNNNVYPFFVHFEHSFMYSLVLCEGAYYTPSARIMPPSKYTKN